MGLQSIHRLVMKCLPGLKSMISSRCVLLLATGITIASLLSSCSSTVVRHLDPHTISQTRRDSINRQFSRAEVQLRTLDRQYTRKAGMVYLLHDTLFLRSSVLFDTLRIPIGSVRELHCFERMPTSTIILATLGGAAAGYVVGKVSTQQSNADLPLGFGIIGGLSGAFMSIISEKETLYLFDGTEEETEPVRSLKAPTKVSK